MINITSANGVVSIVITDSDAQRLQEATRHQIEHIKNQTMFSPDYCPEFNIALENLKNAILVNV